MRVQKIENRSRIQGVNHKNLKMFQSVHCLMSDLSQKISWKSVHPFFRYVDHRNGFPWKHIKQNHVCKRLNIPPSPPPPKKKKKKSDCSLNLSQHILKISWKFVHWFSRNVVKRQTNTQTDKLTNQQSWKHNLRRSVEVIMDASIGHCLGREDLHWNFEHSSITGNIHKLWATIWICSISWCLNDVFTLDSPKTSQIAKFMGPTWGPPGSRRPQVVPMLAPWTLVSEILPENTLLLCVKCDMLCIYF